MKPRTLTEVPSSSIRQINCIPSCDTDNSINYFSTIHRQKLDTMGVDIADYLTFVKICKSSFRALTTPDNSPLCNIAITPETCPCGSHGLKALYTLTTNEPNETVIITKKDLHRHTQAEVTSSTLMGRVLGDFIACNAAVRSPNLRKYGIPNVALEYFKWSTWGEEYEDFSLIQLFGSNYKISPDRSCIVYFNQGGRNGEKAGEYQFLNSLRDSCAMESCHEVLSVVLVQSIGALYPTALLVVDADQNQRDRIGCVSLHHVVQLILESAYDYKGVTAEVTKRVKEALISMVFDIIEVTVVEIEAITIEQLIPPRYLKLEKVDNIFNMKKSVLTYILNTVGLLISPTVLRKSWPADLSFRGRVDISETYELSSERWNNLC